MPVRQKGIHMNYMKKLLVITMVLILSFVAMAAWNGDTTHAATTDMPEKAVSYRASATGSVWVEPDIAYLTVGATSEHENAAIAMANVNVVMDAILAAVKEVGIADDDVKTSHISIELNYDYSGSSSVFIGYFASNSLSLTIRDLDKIPAVLDALIVAGANDINNLYFDKEEKRAAYNEALALAVEKARDKINVLHTASGLGGTLKAVCFDELGVQPYTPSACQMNMGMGEEAMGVTVIPGLIELVAQVSVEFVIAK
ncbi:MAG: SIMPL domain-containing protein [Clostridiaceae bacterium]|nr:SIMPL domain-containing protein [Clostridiaceae bacterium]